MNPTDEQEKVQVHELIGVRLWMGVVLAFFLGVLPGAAGAQDVAQREAMGDVEAAILKLSEPPGPFNLTLALAYNENSGNIDAATGSAGIAYSKFWKNGWGVVTDGLFSHGANAGTTHDESYAVNFFLSRRISNRLALLLVEEWRRNVFEGLPAVPAGLERDFTPKVLPILRPGLRSSPGCFLGGGRRGSSKRKPRSMS